MNSLESANPGQLLPVVGKASEDFAKALVRQEMKRESSREGDNIYLLADGSLIATEKSMATDM